MLPTHTSIHLTTNYNFHRPSAHGVHDGCSGLTLPYSSRNFTSALHGGDGSGSNFSQGLYHGGCGGFGQSTWSFNKPQCQVCGKLGHIAFQC